MYFNHDSVKQVFCPCPICSSTLTHLSSTNGLFFFKRVDASAFQSFSRSLLCNDAFPPERAPFGRHTCSFKVLLKKKNKKAIQSGFLFFFNLSTQSLNVVESCDGCDAHAVVSGPLVMSAV